MPALHGHCHRRAATALSGVQAGLVIVTSLVVIGYWLRERRLANWRMTPLMFEDEFPDQPVQLQL